MSFAASAEESSSAADRAWIDTCIADRAIEQHDPDKMRATYEASRRRASKAPMVTHRAVAKIEEDLHMSGRVGRFELESDEPAELGGGGGAPTALQYVVAGAAF